MSYLSFNISKTIASQVVFFALAFGCVEGSFLKLATLLTVALAITSGLLNEDFVFNFSEISLINCEFCLFLPCLICLPFKAKL